MFWPVYCCMFQTLVFFPILCVIVRARAHLFTNLSLQAHYLHVQSGCSFLLLNGSSTKSLAPRILHSQVPYISFLPLYCWLAMWNRTFPCIVYLLDCIGTALSAPSHLSEGPANSCEQEQNPTCMTGLLTHRNFENHKNPLISFFFFFFFS